MSAKCLLIGSPEAYSGKSAVILGMLHRFQQMGFNLAYSKPVGTCPSEAGDDLDEDVRFIAETLGLSSSQILATLLNLDQATIAQRISGDDTTNYLQEFVRVAQAQVGDLVLIEGPGTLDEGRLFGLSLPQMAVALNAEVVLVSRFHSELVIDSLLAAQERLGDRLVGVLINDVPADQMQQVEAQVRPYLEGVGIPVLGIFPRSALLRSVSVAELVHQLNAEVLCRGDRLDLMVEELKIGAMNVSSALKYFRKARNMAVVTGGDRTDIQLAALETSTHCLILTGQIPPTQATLARAEEMEIPVLSVDLDTLTTVEIIDRAFGQVRLHETIKVQYVQQMVEKHLNAERVLDTLGFKSVATTASP